MAEFMLPRPTGGGLRAVNPKSLFSTYSQLPSVSPVMKKLILLIFLGAAFVAAPTNAGLFSFSTGSPDGKMATASRLDSPGKFEIESADDFVLTRAINITSATFTGLLPAGATIAEVQVEIYRVFPNDSDVSRTSGPPTFSTSQVPTRVNSPSDVALDSRNSLLAGGLSFTTTDLGAFSALNSVTPGGIHPKPDQTTGGNLGVTGQEVQFNISFTSPFNLPADHYFFVPQVELTGADDNFFWLSAPRPIVPPGTPFPPGFTDLQAWTRDAFLDPDWLRVGTDIVGGDPAPTFNMAFSLAGVPDSGSTALLFASATGALVYLRRRFRPI
jgi:VPDSG-CTERM motif